MQNIRNFCIIAHIDHGKSTLADRFIQLCGGLSEREMHNQVLDSMSLERERGITIKAQSVALNYQSKKHQNSYQLNIIDTPGHVDFSYEVSRSLAACEGALLVVDATQGVEAQSVANCFVAIDHGLAVIPVLNKIDLSSAEPERVIEEIEGIIGIEAKHALSVSAKSGLRVEDLLDQITDLIPSPLGKPDEPLKALIIDSWFDNYLGVVSLVRIIDGQIKSQDKIKMMSSGNHFIVDKVGVFTPKRTDKSCLNVGEIGYVIAGIKDIGGAPIGDTITGFKKTASTPLAGFKKITPKVFSGLYPINSGDYESFRDALTKLSLNDAALYYEPESSTTFGFGFRCGFLGMLHMEIIQERLEREYNLALIATAPTVIYEIKTTDDKILMIDNPSKLPISNTIAHISEPIITADILLPDEYLGNVITLCIQRRGVQKKQLHIGRQISLSFDMPMSEIVVDFFDRLKSVSRGYASFDYQFSHFQSAHLVRLDILINQQKVDALSHIVHYNHAQSKGRELTEKLKELIPRQMYEVAIQAAIGSKIIARQNVKAMRKNVTAKCYGGDITRKRKLLEKQKEGKKRMKQFGSVEIPQSAFMAILHVGKNI